MKTCDSCGVEWVYKTGVDIKDHWYEYGSIMFCEQCHSDGKLMNSLWRILKKS